MSNILQKLFIENYNLVQGPTLQKWNAPVIRTQNMPFPQEIPVLNQLGLTTSNQLVSAVIGSDIPYQWVVNVDTTGSFPKISSVVFTPVDKSWSVLLTPDTDSLTDPRWNIYSTGAVSVGVDYAYLGEDFYNFPNEVRITATSPGYYSQVEQPTYYAAHYDSDKGWNSSARSSTTIVGDGTASFSSRIDTTGAVVGLNELFDSSGSGYFEISYSILFKKRTYSVVEQGTIKTSALVFNVDDVFSISRVNDDIFYLINGTVFYKSLRPSTDELLLDCSLYAAGDAIYNAVLLDGSNIIEADAAITTTSSVYAEPKATATLEARSATGFTGVYDIDGDVYAVVNISGGSTLEVAQSFGGYPVLSSSSNLTAISHTATGVTAALGAMTALLSTRLSPFAEINVKLSSMTGQASIGELIIENTTISGGFERFYVDARLLSGENTLDTIMPLPAMTVLAADPPYAAISGTLASMNGYAGEYQDFGNYAFVPFITSSILASGYLTELNGADLEFIDIDLTVIESYGGAITEEEAVNFADFSTFSCTGTHLDYGNANIAFSTFTLSSTGIGYGNSTASIGFISSTITSFGGVKADITAPVFNLSGTGSYIDLGGASLDFLTWSVSSTGTLDASGNATIGFPVFTSVWGSAVLPAPFLNLSATGSTAVANSIAYVLNIVTNESTRYTNQNWDHIVVLGNKPYGVTSTGLYLLEGATDNGVAIDTYMATKETDLGSNMAKSIPTIYLNSDTLTYTTAYMDGVAQTPQASSFTGRKCHLSRGAEARYVKLKISGIKNLQGLEILPELKSRRVK